MNEEKLRFGYTVDVGNTIIALRASNLQALTNLDKNNIALMGHSMGGGVTMQLMTPHPDLANFWILYAPV